VGNVEARDVMADVADILVADGFAGNLILKNTEGVAMALLKIIKSEMMTIHLITEDMLSNLTKHVASLLLSSHASRNARCTSSCSIVE
jgi:fatty acid/phospholipid biosynthesis enzyme